MVSFRKVYIAVAFAILIVAAGCTFEPGSNPEVCFSENDCTDNRLCIQGVCSNGQGRPDTGSPDIVESSDTTAPTDTSLPDSCRTDVDGDGFFVGSDCPEALLDCNDSDALINPGASQRCNGQDNDCDGEIDTPDCECVDGQTGPCGSDVGECNRGERLCIGGVWGECVGEITPVAETCDGDDNNCDGTTDEGCPCMPGQAQTCGTDVGECETGTQTCENGKWSECLNGVVPSNEVCDGKDNDCDGENDNATVDIGGVCQSGLDGVCAGGVVSCEAGVKICRPLRMPSGEVCNNLDDDCNGAIDDAITMACNTNCGAGTSVCATGVFERCVPTNPPPEVCDGNDNNCDGVVDETFPGVGQPCITGLAGVCGEGTNACVNGGEICQPTVAPMAETCDGEDNDCNGVADDDGGGQALTQPCSGPTCPTLGAQVCDAGAWSDCVQHIDICDGNDSNCDSVADNQSTCFAICANGSLTEGTQTCGNNTCTLSPEICGDGIDNNCDGAIDTGCDTSLDNMVLVPGGSFIMGSENGVPDADPDETPVHTAELNPYYIDKFEVSRSEYAACVTQGQCTLLTPGCPAQLTQQQKPITCVTSLQARTFCAGLGKRLPTEAEWEKAARGPYSRTQQYPWGANLVPNNARFGCVGSLNACLVNVNGLPAGASFYGLHNMSGNAAEIVADFYSANFYTANYTLNPFNNVNSGFGLTVRGGSFSQAAQFIRVSNRASTGGFGVPSSEVGFRCARTF